MEQFTAIIYGITFIYIVLSAIVLVFILLYKQFALRRQQKQQQAFEKWRVFFERESLELSTIEIEKLKNSEQLLQFMKAKKEYASKNQAHSKIQLFVQRNLENWLSLGNYYAKQSMTLRAFFAWCTKELGLQNLKDSHELIQLMQKYTLFPSLYCRMNALSALYSFGNTKAVVDTFQLLSQKDISSSSRLVADGLGHFQGDKRELADALYHNFSSFETDIQVGIVDYFRKDGEHLKHQLIDLLKDPLLNRELACALMRYYKKYPVQEYKPVILSWMSWKNRYQWEIIAVTASTLIEYPGEDTVAILKKSLAADNWFIRKNAGIALEELGVQTPQLEATLFEEQTEDIDQLTYDLSSKEGV